MSSESENAPDSPKPAIVSKSSEHIYHWSKDPISHEEAIAIENIHEATLRELLRARNLAVSQLLLERNQLLRERVDLGAEPVSYCDLQRFSLAALLSLGQRRDSSLPALQDTRHTEPHRAALHLLGTEEVNMTLGPRSLVFTHVAHLYSVSSVTTTRHHLSPRPAFSISLVSTPSYSFDLRRSPKVPNQPDGSLEVDILTLGPLPSHSHMSSVSTPHVPV
ncbi:hypothetical protein EDB84DRAFT_1560692 [Lactarius hengduanensis]|nr:hypothetical protein EDB84DRAFT_1560692 [Lactarius hengduanensis]